MARGGKRRIAAVAVSALAVLVLFAFSIVVPAPEKRLVVLDGTGKILEKVRLPEGRFDHVFTHSVHLTPVIERFEILPGGAGQAARLHLYELRYQSSGVGMPSDAEGGYRLEGAFFVLSMDRSFAEIPLRVSIVEGHGVKVDGEFLPFTRWAPQRGALVLRGEIGLALHLRRFWL